jgi:MarR family transcriptional regulator for hemolysin
MSVSSDACAQELLEVIPAIMRAIRSEMRSRRTPDLSAPQFRILAFVNRQPGASLSDVAEHVGLTLPSTSTSVDRLVARKLIAREHSQTDRRRVTLSLTATGKTLLKSARKGAQTYLAARLSTLSAEERKTIMGALQALRPLFTSETERKT